jgi:hypothetical protein
MMSNLHSAPDQSTDLEAAPIILTFCALSSLHIFLIYSRNVVFGSEPGKWVYPYFNTITSIHVTTLIIVFLLLGIIILLGSRFLDSFERSTVLVSVIAASIIQILIRTAYPISLKAIVRSDGANSFYTAAMRYSPLEVLSQFSLLAPMFPGHAQHNMPGKILFFYFLELFTTSPSAMGYLIVLLSTLGAMLLYGIIKKLFHHKLTAFYGMILYTLIPARLLFFPILNVITPVAILLCMYLVLVYIERKTIIIPLLLGVVFYLLILFEPSPLATAPIFVGIFLSAIGRKRISQEKLYILFAVCGLSFMGMYLIFLLMFKFDLLDAFLYVWNNAILFNRGTQRDYWIWLCENPKEFFYAAGLPVMMIFTYMIVQVFFQWHRLRKNITQWSLETLFLLSLLVTVGALMLSGVNRGETTRLWIYLAVFFQVPAAIYIARTRNSQSLFLLVACTLALQSIITLERVGFVMPGADADIWQGRTKLIVFEGGEMGFGLGE